MSKEEFNYSGLDTLEALVEAVNYSNYQKDFILKALKKIKTQKINILDFGAGIGTYSDMLKKEGYEIDCVEPDATQAGILERKGYKVYRDVKDIKKQYDVIYSLNVFEHIEDDSKALSDLKRCINKSGVILLYVPAFMLLFTQLDVNVEHFRRYRIKDMKQLAQDNRLQLESVKYCDPIGFFAALVYRVVGGSGNLNKKSVKFFDRFLFPISVFIEPLTRKLFGKNILGVYSNK